MDGRDDEFDLDAEALGPRPSRDLVGWFSSLVVHGLACLLLAWATLPPLPIASTFNLLADRSASEQLEESLDLEEASFEIAADTLSEPLDSAALDSPVAQPMADLTAATPVSVSLTDVLSETALASPTEMSLSVIAGVGTDGRSTAGKKALVAAKGGTRASEQAVARALGWLVDHQLPDGSWSLNHTRGTCNGRCGNPGTRRGEPVKDSKSSATGLALLPFLGAGETHLKGRYKRQIRAGLAALVAQGEKDDDNPGLSWADSGNLYAHGIATIVLCEAYGLTGDSDLRRPAQAALTYLAYAQDPQSGGWRYRPQQTGDTSVSGWQIMGLKSGLLAGLAVKPRVVSRATSFLDLVSNDTGAAFGYLPAGVSEDGEPTNLSISPTRNAIGLLCRQYLGWDQKDPRLVRGVAALAKRGPIEGHFYHNYYAAQTIFHQTGGVGPVWRQWNEPTREQLIDLQERRGHEKGSWWTPKHHNERGGRLYATAMATMTLEVYYRYLPLYKEEAVAFELPD